MLLPGCFREELKQRRWGKGLSRGGPIGSRSVTLVKAKSAVPLSRHPGEPSWIGDFGSRTARKSSWVPDVLRSDHS